MQISDIPRYRLHVQRLSGPKFATAAAAVTYFGAVQAQDYLYALWALGLRVEKATQAVIEQDIAERRIARTWALRSTIHFVAAADLRWMISLSAERVVKAAAGRLQRLELDEETFRRSRDVTVAELRDGKLVTRAALYAALNAAGISTVGERGYHLMWYHAHEGLICIGPRRGKQQTFALLDEWLPPGRELSRDEASAELALRYFTSHGPATLKDFTWWSGLAPAEARSGLEAVRAQLIPETIAGETYWLAAGRSNTPAPSPVAHLLPYVDEYLVAYQDRHAVQPPEYNTLVDSGNIIFHAPILIDGQVAGIWTRKLKKRTVDLSLTLFRALADTEHEALQLAIEPYGAFLGLSVQSLWQS